MSNEHMGINAKIVNLQQMHQATSSHENDENLGHHQLSIKHYSSVNSRLNPTHSQGPVSFSKQNAPEMEEVESEETHRSLAFHDAKSSHRRVTYPSQPETPADEEIQVQMEQVDCNVHTQPASTELITSFAPHELAHTRNLTSATATNLMAQSAGLQLA